MRRAEVKKHIDELRKKQNDPYSWPDFLTGLPGKSAVIRMLDGVYAKPGHAIAYVRIANIYPYLIRYGYENHAEIIEWAAAALKTASDTTPGSFAGTVGTHDFVLMAREKHIDGVLDRASAFFGRHAKRYYTPDDRQKGTVLCYQIAGKTMQVGLMRLIHFCVKGKPPVTKAELIAYLADMCSKLESNLL